MANVNTHQNAPQVSSIHVSPLAGGTRKNGGGGGGGSGAPKVPQYLTVEQEKEALRRYEEAKMAVDRVHHNPYESNAAAPIAYDSLYPKPGASSSSGAGAGAGAADAPPSFEASMTGPNTNPGPMSAMAEKAALAERMRLEEAAAAAGGMQNQNAAPPPSFNAVQDNIQQQYRDAAAEKEDVRKKLEAKDAAAAAKRARHQQQRQQSLRNQHHQTQPLPPPQHAMPQPPSGAQVMTAAEEKARLKAKFEGKDAARMMGQKKVNGMPTPPASPRPQVSSFQSSNTQVPPQQRLTTPVSSPHLTPPPPPPLMPRPPADYIRETREEDERVSRVVSDGAGFDDEGSEGGGSGASGGVNGRGYAAGIYMNGNSSGSLSKRSLVAVAPGPPPPLPPKPAGE